MAELRQGWTTGACAAAAAKAAALLLCGEAVGESVEIAFPDGSRERLPLLYARRSGPGAEAAVRKDAGDDPDVTHGSPVIAAAEWAEGDEVLFAAGDGVGVVTRPGLAVPPGEPAINPGPRAMIRAAVREATKRGVRVTVSIPGGRELAERTFNPRLGVEGGLSILGSTGRVRPFSHEALCAALRCALDVAAAGGIQAPVLVPGHIGERAARARLKLGAQQVVEVSNEWGFMLDEARGRGFSDMLALGHPGKLAKLWRGDWDTHSSRSASPAPAIIELGQEILGKAIEASATVEGIFQSLAEAERRTLADALAGRIREAIQRRMGERPRVAVALVNLAGEWLGWEGDLSPWS